MEETLKILDTFEPISLEEMKNVKLLNRVDTKYTFHRRRLPEILNSLKDEYRVFEVDHVRASQYETLYFDTVNFDLYKQHHCGRLNRYKIRFRSYKDSNLTFFEIKFKNNKKRTIKERIRRDCIEEVLQGDVRDFLMKNSPINPDDLMARLWVDYTRITLVNKFSQERLTIDLDLTYRFGNKTVSYPKLVIAELKQDKSSKSCFALLMKHMHIHVGGISKYCFGIYSVHEHVKINNFKQKFRIINKIAS